jgi:hypothetical protein
MQREPIVFGGVFGIDNREIIIGYNIRKYGVMGLGLKKWGGWVIL